MNISQKFRIARAINDHSREQAEEASGLSRSTMYEIEKNNKLPTSKLLLKAMEEYLEIIDKMVAEK